MKSARPSSQAILRQIAALRAEPVQTALAAVLDGVDAWGSVEMGLRLLPRLISWGPKAVRGMTPVPWVGAILWQRGSGYTGYRTLRVAGIWAVRQGEADGLIVGEKRLAYTAPTYEAEAYHQIIRRSFDLYYQDEGGVPSAHAFEAVYDPDSRLALRDAVRQALLSLLSA